MSEDRKPQSADKYIVRFPDGMRDKIAEAAEANNRSMNAEIVARLNESFERDRAVEVQTFTAGVEASMLREEVARLTRMLQEAHEIRLLPAGDSTSGTSFAPSLLAKLAGRLHDLQGKRNTLALVANALKQSNADTSKLLQVQEELERLDEGIAQVLIDIQSKKTFDH